MDWNSNDNPWGPGGRYHQQLPWANQGTAGMQHGWQQAGGFFTPKSQAQIQREALLQLAILAAVVAAPALLGAGGGGGAAAGMGASAESATAITTQGASLAGSGATSSISAAALQPFIGAAALQNLVNASTGGPQALNQALQQSAPATVPGYVFDPGTVAPELDKDGRHPALPMLDNVAYGLKHSPALLQRLKLALAANKIHRMGQDRELLALVADAAAQVAPGNPWAGGLNAVEQDSAKDNCSTANLNWSYEWFRAVGTQLYLASILAGFSRHGGLVVLAHAYKERATSELGRKSGYLSNNWWGLTPIRNQGETACENSRFACFPTVQEGFNAYFRRMTSPLQITNALAPDFNPSYPDFGQLLRKEEYPSAYDVNTALRIGTGNFVFCYPCETYGEDMIGLLPNVKQDFSNYLSFEIRCIEGRIAKYNRFGGNSPMFDYGEDSGEETLRVLKEILNAISEI